MSLVDYEVLVKAPFPCPLSMSMSIKKKGKMKKKTAHLGAHDDLWTKTQCDINVMLNNFEKLFFLRKDS